MLDIDNVLFKLTNLKMAKPRWGSVEVILTNNDLIIKKGNDYIPLPISLMKNRKVRTGETESKAGREREYSDYYFTIAAQKFHLNDDEKETLQNLHDLIEQIHNEPRQPQQGYQEPIKQLYRQQQLTRYEAQTLYDYYKGKAPIHERLYIALKSGNLDQAWDTLSKLEMETVHSKKPERLSTPPPREEDKPPLTKKQLLQIGLGLMLFLVANVITQHLQINVTDWIPPEIKNMGWVIFIIVIAVALTILGVRRYLRYKANDEYLSQKLGEPLLKLKYPKNATPMYITKTGLHYIGLDKREIKTISWSDCTHQEIVGAQTIILDGRKLNGPAIPATRIIAAHTGRHLDTTPRRYPGTGKPVQQIQAGHDKDDILNAIYTNPSTEYTYCLNILKYLITDQDINNTTKQQIQQTLQTGIEKRRTQ